MGGGDLNLKKSWHPSTLKNIERVWKAEQKHEAEQKKIEQLQRELAEERARQEMRQFAEDQGVVKRRQERLDWMYQGPSSMVNREDYLLGRPIDKTFEVIQKTENGVSVNSVEETEGSMPNSLFSGTSDVVAVDLATKIREDPLFLIRKQEEESKKRLLNNPVRMKQLQQLLKQQIEKKEMKKRKKNKNKKSKTKESSSDSSSSEDEYIQKKEKMKYEEYRETKSRKEYYKEETSREIQISSHKSRKDEKYRYDKNYKKSEVDFDRQHNYKKTETRINGHNESKSRDHRKQCYDSSSDERSSSVSKNNSKYLKYRHHEKIEDEHFSRKSRYNDKSSRPQKERNSRLNIEEESDQENFKKYKYNSTSKNLDHKKIKKRHHSESEEESYPMELVKSNHQNHHDRDATPDDTRHKDHRHKRHDSSSDEDRPKKKTYGLIISERYQKHSSSKTKLGRYSRSRSRSRSPSASRNEKNKNSSKESKTVTSQSLIQKQQLHKRKLSAKEMEKRRQEMMTDAKWRDEQRLKNVQRYQKEEEIEMKQTHKGTSDDFIRPMLSKAAAVGSVESRIKSNMYNIQRSKTDMEGSFAKR